tara:strand:+ start:2872 stop:3540 length:669 start_codon:yes stop_codon:yes gene_type:complete
MRKEPKINLYNQDCMEALKEFEDDFFELAIVDPPYGIHNRLTTTDTVPNKSNQFALRYMEKNWDKSRPTKEYFSELRRVSKNQIIWGGNYFADLLPPSRGWICWDKMQDKFTCVNNELAWTSFDIGMKMFRRMRNMDTGFMIREPHQKFIHPTQKPLELYVFCLEQYAKKKGRILDTHLGSGSSAIVCDMLGFDMWGYEIDKDYYEGALNRFDMYKQQLRLF